MSNKTSKARTSKRRHGALIRRQENLKQVNSGVAPYDILDDEARATKRSIIESDIANLLKKGTLTREFV